jgi:hypothetical protein
MGDPRAEAFTLVFGGDIRQLKANPLTAETPFGVAYAAGVGDLFNDIDEIRDLLAQAMDAADRIECKHPGWTDRAEKLVG